jgi:two-component system OmpR family response regulator
MKILVVEDNRETANYVLNGLEEKGHTTSVSSDGREGLFRAASESWDVLIVDRMLPHLDGLGMVRTLRSGGVQVPVLFLTTMSGIDDRVSGLEAGGDDYLVKPFAFAELIARVNALGRRPHRIVAETVLKVADLKLDLIARLVHRGSHVVELQPREFRLLEYLMRHAEELVTRTMLLENVWDFHFDPRTNIIESHISRLRRKIAKGGGPELIHTVRGGGYSIRAPT